MKRFYLPLAILGGTLLLCVVLLATRPSIEEVAVEPTVTTIRTITAKDENVTLMVSSRGKVQPAIVSELSTAVGGPVVWISPALVAGGYFEKDDVILRIDRSDFETALEKSRGSMMQAQAEATHSTRELERITDLTNKKLASDSQLEDAKRTAAVQAGRLLDAEAGFRQAQLNLARSEIKSPFHAIVNSRKIELGQFVSTGQSVATLYGADVVEVKLPLANRQIGFLDLPVNYRGNLSNEQTPSVMLHGLYAGRQHTWYGKLVRTEAGIDASNNSVQAIVQVVQPTEREINDDENASAIPLPLGLFVQAEITGQTIDKIIALPRHVIRNNSQILIARPNNTLEIREVDILRLESERVLIRGGLQSGERVCVSPIQAVVDGMPINPIDENES